MQRILVLYYYLSVNLKPFKIYSFIAQIDHKIALKVAYKFFEILVQKKFVKM